MLEIIKQILMVINLGLYIKPLKNEGKNEQKNIKMVAILGNKLCGVNGAFVAEYRGLTKKTKTILTL